MYFCKHCGMRIYSEVFDTGADASEVFGTGADATAFCDNCKEMMNVFKEKKQTFNPKEPPAL